MPFLCHFKGKSHSNVEYHIEPPVEEDIKPFVCDRCHFVGSNFLELDAHKSTCGNNYKCSSCFEMFSSTNLLELHKQSHAERLKYDLVFSSNGEIHMETTPLDQRLANPIKKEYQGFGDVKVEPSDEVAPEAVKQEPCDVKCDIKIKTEDASFQEFDAMMKLFKRKQCREESGDRGTRYYKKSKIKLLKNVQWKNDKEFQKLQDIKMEYDPAEDPAYLKQLREESTARRRARKELRRMNKEAADGTEERYRKRGKSKKHKRSKSKNKKGRKIEDAAECFEASSNVKTSRKRNKMDTSLANVNKHEDGLYRCEFCDYSNQKINSVKMHRMVHIVEKPYRCKQCAKTFRRKSQLQNHKARHPGGQKKCHNSG